MNSDEGNSADPADEFDLIALWRGLRAYKGVIVSMVLSGLMALVFAILATPIFRAEVTITPAREEGMSGSGALSQLNGLASLAGVSLGTGAGPQREGLAVLKSRHLIAEFIGRNDLLPVLFRGSTKPPHAVVRSQAIPARHAQISRGYTPRCDSCCYRVDRPRYRGAMG